MIDLKLAIIVQLRAELLRQFRVENITACGEDVVDLGCLVALKVKPQDLAIAMFDVVNAPFVDRNLIFF